MYIITFNTLLFLFILECNVTYRVVSFSLLSIRTSGGCSISFASPTTPQDRVKLKLTNDILVIQPVSSLPNINRKTKKFLPFSSMSANIHTSKTPDDATAYGIETTNEGTIKPSTSQLQPELYEASSTNELILLQTAKDWIQYDPNPTTAQYVQNLIDAKDYLQLQTLFPTNPTESERNEQTSNHNTTNHASARQEQQQQQPKRIAFGTAGLRGKMLPGPLYMNDLVVIQTAQGIASYCKSVIESNHTSKTTNNDIKLGVAIGYDHRATSMSVHGYVISSLQFALYTTLVFQQAGFHDVYLLDDYVATPIIPFVLGQYSSYTTKSRYKIHESCTNKMFMIGIMITASHNPKDDAGYKIYWSDGCQIRSPIDHDISKYIQQNLIPWVDYKVLLQNYRDSSNNYDLCCSLSDPDRTKNITIPAYYTTLVNSGLMTSQWKSTDASSDSLPTFCYTAMHGIGYQFARKVFTSFGIPKFYSVPEQQEPDPNFPTVQFPNPEEKGALDLAKVFAERMKCDIILANDPDADRLAVVERDRTTGIWTVFTGDQIGAMLGHWLWSNHVASAKYPNTVVAMCASTVSSRLLQEIARVEGFYYEDTLTGFKWIGSRAAELHNSPVQNDPTKTYHTIFSYEEAIGFCCGNIIFDKDGLSAMGVFAELSHAIYQRHMNLSLYMQSLYDKYGEFVSNNGYYFVSDPSIVQSILNNITNHGKFDTLNMVGHYKVISVRYLGVPGFDSSQPDLKPKLLCSKSSPMITIHFDNGCIAQFRGSGTEPKLKYYIELHGQPGTSRVEVTNELNIMSNIILEELLQPEKNGLKRTKH